MSFHFDICLDLLCMKPMQFQTWMQWFSINQSQSEYILHSYFFLSVNEMLVYGWVLILYWSPKTDLPKSVSVDQLNEWHWCYMKYLTWRTIENWDSQDSCPNLILSFQTLFYWIQEHCHRRDIQIFDLISLVLVFN